MKTRFALSTLPFALAALLAPVAHADENLFGFVKGSETLPANAAEAYFWLTHRFDKGQVDYSAYDAKLEYEYGVTSRFTAAAALLGQSIDTSGLVIDGYLPGAESYGFKLSGIELKANTISSPPPWTRSDCRPSLNCGLETQYQTEFETEVGQERYTWLAGPTLHYGSEKWWATLTWFEQLKGGKEQYINQADDSLHLIEKTEHEVRLKLGYNF